MKSAFEAFASFLGFIVLVTNYRSVLGMNRSRFSFSNMVCSIVPWFSTEKSGLSLSDSFPVMRWSSVREGWYGQAYHTALVGLSLMKHEDTNQWGGRNLQDREIIKSLAVKQQF